MGGRIKGVIKYLRLVFECGWRILWDFTFFIWPYARHPERTPIEKRYKKLRDLIIFVLDHYRIDWKVKGLENLRALEKKKQVYLLVADHLSDLDPLSLVYWSERPISFVAKKEIKHFPFIASAVRSLDGVFLDRSDLRQNVLAMKKVESYLEKGYCSVMIFPEGTRNRHPEGPMAPFHPGSLKPAFRTGAPILPLAMWGTQHPFHPNTDYKRYPVQFTFFPAFYPKDFGKDTTIDLSGKIETLIASESYALRALESNYFLMDEEWVPLKKGVSKTYLD